MSVDNNGLDSSAQRGSTVVEPVQSSFSKAHHNGDSSRPASKYVPPHLRNRPQQQQSAPADFENGSSSPPSPPAFVNRQNPLNRGFARGDRRQGPPGGKPFPGSFGRGAPRKWDGDGDAASGSDGAPAQASIQPAFVPPAGPPKNNRWKDDVPPPNQRGKNLPRNERLEKELFGEQKTGINFEKYADIPVETSGQDVPDALKSFDECKLEPTLRENIQLAGYSTPTPVQQYAVPIGLSKRDLMACAQTGSGKTAAFLFPLIEQLLRGDLPSEQPNSSGYYASRRSKTCPFGLILAPTRELATQIFQEARKFCYRTGLKPVVVYGGQDIRGQLRDLERGCDILVATPGRLVDMLDRGRIGLSRVIYLCFDEADRMLDMGFEPQIRVIVENHDMPPKSHRQTLMFSATFPKEIQALAQDFLNDYVFLAVGRVGSTTDFITQRVEYARDYDKRDLLMQILPECDGLTLIFVETKRGADALEDHLLQEGINAMSIHGDRTQQEREHALAMFRCGRCPVLVATDVAARGLDIPNVMHVINYDLPTNIDDYVHRIGRTGRCGHTGTAIAFVNENNKAILRDLYDILKETNQATERWFEDLVASNNPQWGASKRRGPSSRGQNRDFRKGPKQVSYARGSGNFQQQQMPAQGPPPRQGRGQPAGRGSWNDYPPPQATVPQYQQPQQQQQQPYYPPQQQRFSNSNGNGNGNYYSNQRTDAW